MFGENEILDSQTSYGALGSFFFDAAPPLLAIHTTQTGNMELKVHRVHWQPPGFNMVSKVNLLF